VKIERYQRKDEGQLLSVGIETNNKPDAQLTFCIKNLVLQEREKKKTDDHIDYPSRKRIQCLVWAVGAKMLIILATQLLYQWGKVRWYDRQRSTDTSKEYTKK